MAGTLVSTRINNDQTEFVCQSGETLLEVLRNRLGLTGSKEAVAPGTAVRAVLRLTAVWFVPAWCSLLRPRDGK